MIYYIWLKFEKNQFWNVWWPHISHFNFQVFNSNSIFYKTGQSNINKTYIFRFATMWGLQGYQFCWYWIVQYLDIVDGSYVPIFFIVGVTISHWLYLLTGYSNSLQILTTTPPYCVIYVIKIWSELDDSMLSYSQWLVGYNFSICSSTCINWCLLMHKDLQTKLGPVVYYDVRS